MADKKTDLHTASSKNSKKKQNPRTDEKRKEFSFTFNLTKFKRTIQAVFAFFLIAIITLGIVSLYRDPESTQGEKIGINEVVKEINNEKVKEMIVQGNTITIELHDGTKQKTRKEAEGTVSELLSDLGVEKEKLQNVTITLKDDTAATLFFGTILPVVLPFLLIAGFIYFIFRGIQMGNNRALSFGRSSARMFQSDDKKKKVTFQDVAGISEAKEELYEVVEFLKEPKKFTALGARIPRGVILVGPPGTGKTLISKAVAGEANVPFFHLSGSEFVEMFVGVGASRVRDLFKQAKKNAPAIVFIDEIDAVGRQRGAGLGGSHDEREQTLNQILVEMDGFDTDTNVIVIAATNRPDVLDPALLRPGRFDRRIVIELPDIKDREAILKVHSKNKPYAKDVDLRRLAERTPGFAGADLYNLLNEAAIYAARANHKEITMENCVNAIEKVLLGPERKSKVMDEEEKKITAYHEAGHAIAAHFLKDADPVHKVSIISRGMAAGYTLNVPEKDKRMRSKNEYLAQIGVALGGYITEKKVFHVLTTGASNDLKKVSKLARKMVMDWGMSDEFGPITFGEKEELIFLGREIHESKNYSDETATKIDEEVKKIINIAYEKTKLIIDEKKILLDILAQELMKKETIEKKEFDELMNNRIPR